MTRSRILSVFTRRFDGALAGREPDSLVVEEPMTIRLDDKVVTSTMRTPGHDFELAAGFLLAEGLLEPGWVTGIRYCAVESAYESDFNVVSVDTDGQAPDPTPRLGPVSSACGLCGAEAIETLTERLDVLGEYEPWPAEFLVSLPERLATAQPLFHTTGAVHGAAAVDRTGLVVMAREDIGRHNAVDKVTGRLLLDGRLPATDLALVISGRASFEMVQKAWAGGYTALVAVSAPSGLAVTTARRAGLTLVGFARGDRATFYSPADLIEGRAEPGS